ncbi:hypothetical protein NW765_016336 [Fusarium oxysporum]|nr:hypothetical protein NW765_016336 [Fusarium oxysporum]
MSDGRFNVFDQHRLNSFLPRRTSGRPFFYKLQDKTYKKYVRVAQKLICFVYRRAWARTGPSLPFRLTEVQMDALNNTVHTSTALQNILIDGERDHEYMEEIWTRLEDNLLIFYVSLLGHALYRDIYESPIVGFLAVLAIQETDHGITLPQPRLYEAISYTPYLSAFIKISQLLVAERALLAVQRDEFEYPGLALEDMQHRFMVEGTRSPICWAQKLGAYGKAIKDTTTSIGHIQWSDDDETLSYKDTQFTMTQLRSLVTTELEIAQAQLSDLFFIHPEDEDRELVVPSLSLRSLADNPAESAPGWSFICHPKNTALHGHERWLLNRILQTSWLRNDFFRVPKRAIWREQAVSEYVTNVDRFLERLLLLIHITGGQPARGTELLSIRHRNPIDGQGRRNIFIESGLVSFVTYYHKGYNINGSTKIIHRYLPLEVSELVVYYLWLVVPFLDQLRILAMGSALNKLGSSYLWGESTKPPDKSPGEWAINYTQPDSATAVERPWLSTRLSRILVQEFQRLIPTKVTIPIWRHAAIAISRRHLRQAKFKRDFIEAVTWAWNDEMAAHSTKLAGLTYARGLDKAPGHVAGAKAEYRRISREWHAWLGLGGYFTKKKRRF